MTAPARTLRTLPACLLVALFTLAGSCGRKGPPLPPIVRLPGAINDLTARRLGPQVVLRFTVPAANSDNSRPADLDRVEIYAHTDPLPSPADFLRYGTLIGTIPVKQPDGDAGAALPGVEQGAKAVAVEEITPAQLEPGKAPTVRSPLPARPAPADLETEGTVNVPVPVMRYYVAVGASRRNRRGAFSTPVAVPLVAPEAAPATVQSGYAQDAISLSWIAPAPSDDPFVPPPAYNVYEVPEETGVAPAERAERFVSAPPLNAAVLSTASFNDPRVVFGTQRCYVVRTVRMQNGISIESEPTDPVCVTPVDTFPPAAPKALAAVAGDGAINLIWEPNAEPDLAGYLVLRADSPDGDLRPLTPAPIQETTYHDSSVRAGTTYVYVVAAVDNAPEPNMSQVLESSHGDGPLSAPSVVRVFRLDDGSGPCYAVESGSRFLRIDGDLFAGPPYRYCRGGEAGARARARRPLEDRRHRAELQRPRRRAEQAAAAGAADVHEAVDDRDRPG